MLMLPGRVVVNGVRCAKGAIRNQGESVNEKSVDGQGGESGEEAQRGGERGRTVAAILEALADMGGHLRRLRHVARQIALVEATAPNDPLLVLDGLDLLAAEVRQPVIGTLDVEVCQTAGNAGVVGHRTGGHLFAEVVRL